MRAQHLHSYQHFFRHLIKSKGANRIHSPFVFALYNQVLKGKRERLPQTEVLRLALQRSKEVIDQHDFKSGTVMPRTIGEIAKTSLTPWRFSSFLKLLTEFMGAKSILETGTSFGINTLYLAQSKSAPLVTSIEGNQEIAKIAEEQFGKLGISNIILKQGLLIETLEQTVSEHPPEFVFLDADHSLEGVRHSMEIIMKIKPLPRCIVVHDIYWSKEMTTAWHRILTDRRCKLTIDLFHAGLIFPSVPMEKQHFHLKM